VQSLVTTAIELPNGISRNGLSLYFHRINPGTNEDLYVVHRPSPESDWGVPVKLPDGINTNANDRTAFVSADGHWLYFASDRSDGMGGFDLYVSWRTHVHDDGDWKPPVNLAGVNSPGFDAGPTLFGDKESGMTQLYFTSNPVPGGQPARADIYMSALSPVGFEPPTPVIELNSEGNDTRPYLRRDGCEIFFTSNRLGPLTIFVSERSSTTQPWSSPVPAISPADLGDPSVILSGNLDDIYVSHREKVKGKK
jgi:hypothetical protein